VHPDIEIVAVLESRPNGARSAGTFALYRRFGDRSRSLEAIAVMKRWQPTATGAEQPERFEGQRVSAGYFHVLGVSPIVGRGFDPSDDRLAGPNVVVLSDALWRRRFEGDHDRRPSHHARRHPLHRHRRDAGRF
jgi:putative ABC transport system permease protein